MRPARLLTVMLTLAAAPVALAVPLVDSYDLTGDMTGGWHYEILSVGSAVECGKLYFEIRTNYPKAGIWDRDSYAANTHLSTGDIAIGVGVTQPFDPTGTYHGIAVTSHANVVQQAYPGEVWSPVVEGRLYTDATFADGTYEEYEQWLTDRGIPYKPNDHDGDRRNNSYPTLICDYGAEVVGQSSVSYLAADPADSWDYEIQGWVDLDAIGLSANMDYTIFFSTECGNDAWWRGDNVPDQSIPEPGAAALLLMGLIARRRRR